ncbi:MAG: FAD-binding oxidoreductase [Pseudomonadota bacterium]
MLTKSESVTSVAPVSPPDELNAAASRLIEALSRVLAPDEIISDSAARERLSSDVYSQGETARLVIRPADRQRLADAVGLITAQGFAVFPRGGGMSYTGGYLPDRRQAVVVDTSALDAILEVSPENMTITVEAGVTWKAIYETLDPLGLRLPFFGTFSGACATVGGGLSNGALFMGTARYGSGAELVLGLEVVTANGNVLTTGQAGFKNGKGFYRSYGPDLTGLFVHDAGALGVKAAATLRLIKKPSANDYASFVFATAADAAAALSDIARSGCAEEVYVFDPETNRRSMKEADLKADIKRLLNVVKKQGLRAGAGIAAAGRGVAGDDVYSLHLVCAGNTDEAVAADRATCCELALRHRGAEIADSIPRAVRANLFEPLNGILGGDGDRWAALNSKVAHEDAAETIEGVNRIFASHADAMAANRVTFSQLFVAISNHAFSYEPVLRWYDEWLPLHRSTPEPSHLKKLTEPEPNPKGRALVETIRREIVAFFQARGAASTQIGRTYPYYDSLSPVAAELVAALKQSLDPSGLMNPGALGLPASKPID